METNYIINDDPINSTDNPEVIENLWQWYVNYKSKSNSNENEPSIFRMRIPNSAINIENLQKYINENQNLCNQT